ncbi:hypothetical protein ACSTIC_23555, partial [Vibrio parahaemolyticus]
DGIACEYFPKPIECSVWSESWFSDQSQIVVAGVNSDMKGEPVFFLSRAPSSSEEPIDISSKHGAGVV